MSQDSEGGRGARNVELLLDAADRGFAQVLAAARRLTGNGRALDEYQVLTERIASLATALRAARELSGCVRRAAAAGITARITEHAALIYAAETMRSLRCALDGTLASAGLGHDEIQGLDDPDSRLALRFGLAPEFIVGVGSDLLESGGGNQHWLGDEAAMLTRDAVRAFARAEVAPLAAEIHRRDLLVPDALIEQMARLGIFAASIPESYGGSGLGYLAMVVTTEELSAASLVAGSLSTRPEILARALLVGGTEEQRRVWLPRIASGELMVAVAVTEPDAGSDVAALSTRAEPAMLAGCPGFRINGAKAWSTFAGRADLLALLARTNPDPAVGASGLSLFIVPKSRHYGGRFEERQPGGGFLRGEAIPTPGYRGMHSFMLSFEDYFVPAENLVGEEQGRDRGFYLQLAGFAVGRLQTAGRALGVAQAALEQTAVYVQQRRQFGRPIGDYQLTRHTLGRIAVRLAAARQLSYAAAQAMEEAERGAHGSARRNADLLAAMAKLLACDVAVWATQECQILHGGWGYAEETSIARSVVDAQVLPIFEGARPILALKVIGQALLREA
jgi:(2S)-methylsuccinyl-CoA dehydrogenase